MKEKVTPFRKRGDYKDGYLPEVILMVKEDF